MQIIFEASNATAARPAASLSCEFTWGSIIKGGCMMLDGARWTLRPDGTATFDATVTSGEDNRAWVVWHVDLLDRDGAVLGSLATANPVDGDLRKFVRAMPSSAERYRFRASASFDAGLWPAIERMKMYSSC
ncbi:MAG TPA: DUF6294 family protein [Dactylosporangium sp.]|jgi:hypothetical protein|nr:DUF6294 family protein [Dactylosporangium sp.]